MASLRRPSHMPSGPGGKGPPPPSTLRQQVSQGSDIETKRNARKSRVGDAIRRRMSMRYADPGQLFDEEPPMPPGHLPPGHHFLDVDPYGGLGRGDEDAGDTGESRFGQFASREYTGSDLGRGSAASQGGGDEGIRRRGGVDTSREEEWDFDELNKEGADVQSFIRRNLTGADAEEKKRFIAALQRFKQNNQREMQRNVFKHYAEFVNISKEISTLEHDMLELKELLGQWKDLPQLMGMDDTLAPTLDKSGNIERKRTLRNSVLDLQQVYKAQLTTLWSTVEGSQKYLPIAPGRHLVFETHTFVELNAATYKAKQSVSLFLLSDLLLIAGRRRTKTAVTPQLSGEDKGRERGRMVAERCWVLADLVVIDVKDSGDLTNALKIRRGKETCVYRTSRPEDKKSLLAAFRQVSQELSEKKRKESEKEQERRRTMWLGDTGGKANKRASLLAHDRPLSTIGTSLADSKDLRWIDDFGDELTMAIATRNFDEAVEQVEKGKELLHIAEPNPTALSTLTARLDHLRTTLVQSLAADLSYPDIRKARSGHLIGLLIRLDKAQLARDSFLEARHNLITKRVRAIRAEGDISLYVSELAVVCFTVVRNTGDWYMTAFKENRAASGFVAWAKKQIELFAELFRRQVYAPNVGDEVVRECLQVTASHNRNLLKDVGLDFTFLLSSLLQPPTSSTSTSGFDAGNGRTRPTVVIPTSTPAPTGFDINPSPFVNYSMGMGMGTPAIDSAPNQRHEYEQDYDPHAEYASHPRGGYDGTDSRFDHEAYEEAPDSARRTAPLAIKKTSKEAGREKEGDRERVASPPAGLAPGVRGDGGRYRVDMSRSGSSRSGEGDSLR